MMDQALIPIRIRKTHVSWQSFAEQARHVWALHFERARLINLIAFRVRQLRWIRRESQ